MSAVQSLTSSSTSYQSLESATSVRTSHFLIANGTSHHHDVPDDTTTLHIIILLIGTIWWYAYSSLSILWLDPPNNFFGWSTSVVRLLGIYVLLSQLAVICICWFLTKATTLHQAQMYVAFMFCLCVPADMIVTLMEPAGSKGVTVAAFAIVTLFFGVFLAHYLVKASCREVGPIHYDHDACHQSSIWKTIATYRPPMHLQAS